MRAWGNGDRMAKASAMKSGSLVEVLVDFQGQHLNDPMMLRHGMEGTVTKIDDDGDALIRFNSIDEPQWVFNKDFSKLRMKARGTLHQLPSHVSVHCSPSPFPPPTLSSSSLLPLPSSI